MFTLRNAKTGLYVALPGRHHSYTNRIEYAQQFKTRDEAIATSCPDNEYPFQFRSLTEREN